MPLSLNFLTNEISLQAGFVLFGTDESDDLRYLGLHNCHMKSNLTKSNENSNEKVTQRQIAEKICHLDK